MLCSGTVRPSIRLTINPEQNVLLITYSRPRFRQQMGPGTTSDSLWLDGLLLTQTGRSTNDLRTVSLRLTVGERSTLHRLTANGRRIVCSVVAAAAVSIAKRPFLLQISCAGGRHNMPPSPVGGQPAVASLGWRQPAARPLALFSTYRPDVRDRQTSDTHHR